MHKGGGIQKLFVLLSLIPLQLAWKNSTRRMEIKQLSHDHCYTWNFIVSFPDKNFFRLNRATLELLVFIVTCMSKSPQRSSVKHAWIVGIYYKIGILLPSSNVGRSIMLCEQHLCCKKCTFKYGSRLLFF